ncbi:MAG TPA: thiamine pyrophosphate-binding protein [Acidimicrobiia bacterium]|nr:thiamine pyrophosphate-binding protein [Acidimicrobiia bacterium]
MPPSPARAKILHDALSGAGVDLVATLPETWLVPLLRALEADPGMRVVEVAKEDEAVGIAMGAHLAGARAAALMQNHGLFASLNAVLSGTMLYRVPLLLLISDRGHFGERDPWQTEGGRHTRPVLDAVGIVHDDLVHPDDAARKVADALTLAEASLSPVALLLTHRFLWEAPA